MTKYMPLPPLEYLQEHLRYDPDTGLFWWRKQGPRGSARNLFKPAGNIHKEYKYARLGIKGKVYKAHRIAWLLYYKQDPGPFQIDHIDRDKNNNKINNLRLVTNQQNTFNVGTQSNNTSGVTGVSWHKKAKRWQAHGKLDGKCYNLGYFDSKNDAIAARAAWKQETLSKLGV
jgi:hypothetical protein